MARLGEMVIHVALFGDLGNGKTTLAQIIAGNFSVGRVSAGQDSVLSYSECYNPDGSILVKDLPGKKSLEQKDKHVAHQLRGLREPNNALICTILAQERIDLVVGEISEMTKLFDDPDRPGNPKPGLAFIITRCDKVDHFDDDPEAWKADALKKISQEVPSLDINKQIFFSHGLGKRRSTDENQWQTEVVGKWQVALSWFIKCNASSKKVPYVSVDMNNLDSQAKFEAFVRQAVGKTTGKAEWHLKQMTLRLTHQRDRILRTLEAMGAKPDEKQVLSLITDMAKSDAENKHKLANEGLIDASDPWAEEVLLLHDYYQTAAQLQRGVREACYRKLPYNPTDAASEDNRFRRCPHCGQMWVKMLGCSGQTTCGARAFQWDNVASLPSITNLVWNPARKKTLSSGSWSAQKPTRNEQHKVALQNAKYRVLETGHGVGVGCGLPFVWADQPRPGDDEIAGLLTSTVDEYKESTMVRESIKDKMAAFFKKADEVNPEGAEAGERRKWKKPRTQ